VVVRSFDGWVTSIPFDDTMDTLDEGSVLP
jgi:hypothetical protein